MPAPERALLSPERMIGSRHWISLTWNRGREQSFGYEIAWSAAESKSPARFPARAQFLNFYFTIYDSMPGGNNKIAAWVFFAHRRGSSVGSIRAVSSVRIASEAMSRIW
jgi:hypothetical protein